MKILAVGSAFLLCAGLAVAQEPKVFKGNAVTESNLIEALTPTPQLRTRSIRVTKDEPAKAPSASLLITFETNSTALTGESKSALDVVARALAKDQLATYSFIVEGHADPRGSHEYNLHLSQMRADTVREYLVSKHGLKEARLKAVGKGDAEPLNANDPKAPENRRVTFVTVTP
jgi:outer membrane protein OmpA-like peptidoglycan-associated protein